MCILPAGEFGWPTSTILQKIPESDEEKTQLIDMLQDWKTLKYQELVCEPSSPSLMSVARYSHMLQALAAA